jgi:cytoskeletal protein CcmA (bactofilin family)
MLALSLFSSSSRDRKNETKDSSKDSPTRDTEVSTSIISEGANVEGVLDFNSVNLRIEGTVHGDISTDERVVVAEGAEVQGTINARTVRLAGYVDGHVLATEQLVLCPTSEVHATLEADVLEIQPGADFSGEVPEAKPFVPDAEEPVSSTIDSTELISASNDGEPARAGNGEAEHQEAGQ